MKPITPIDLPADIRSRVGRFTIATEFLDDQPGLFMAVLSCCLIVRAEHLGYKNEMEYIAYSADFAVVGYGEQAPLYRLVISEEDREYGGYDETTFSALQTVYEWVRAE